MKICYFGDYDPTYNRTKVILKGLNRVGATVLHCNDRGGGIKMFLRLWKKHRKLRGSYDILFVGLGNSRFIPTFARFLTFKPLVWEPLYSIYDNWVHDRKYVKPYTLKALKLWLSDWLGCKLSDFIILDTNTHRKYFIKTFSLPPEKVGNLHVGADTDIFFPREHKQHGDSFEIEFHGKYIPLHGVETIIQAAKILEDDHIHFTMIGAGQEEEKAKQQAKKLRVKNVTFLPFMPQEKVCQYISDADACIGMIGDVPRIVRSIPNKMWETAAMARVSISADTSSLREVFTTDVDCIGVRPGHVNDLVEAIRRLKNSGRAKEMGEAAYQTFLKYGTPEIIGAHLARLLKDRFPQSS